MENEILSIIELIKSANSYVFPAALHAAKISGIFGVTIGGLMLLATIIIFYITYKKKWDDFLYICGGILFCFGFVIFIVSAHTLLTLEFEAFKLILGR